MPLSSQRQRFSIFVSPRNEDFLFYEKVDKQRVLEEIPEYGDPHPDYRKYPNHFFAQAVQADEEGQIYYYYYAAKRDNQDEYNWEHTTVDHKQLTYDQVERTYVTLRSEYDEDSPALGSSMPLTDSDPFETTDNYALISRGQVRLGEASSRSVKNGENEMDSMFVIERRIYLKRAPITTTAYDKQTGAHIFTTTNLVHRDETPEGSSLTVAGLIADSSNPFWDVDEETGSHKVIEQVSEEWYYVSSVQNGEANERRVFLYLTPNQNDFVFYELVDRRNEKLEPDPLPAFGETHPEFGDHKFVAAVPNDNIGDFYKYYYARDRFNEDQYNFSESFVDIGGVRVSLVRRSYVVLRSAYDPTAPVIGASMPSAPDNKFTGNYLLVDRVQRPIEDETLSSLYVSEERVYAKTPDVGSQEGNFTLQEGGLTITRTWIVPRDQVGAFPKPSIGSPDSEYGQYEYATRRVSQETPPEIDSYFSVVLDIYAKKGWAFQEEHQYNIGYKIIETTTLEDDKAGEGNYSVAFDERGWQKQQRSAELTGFDFESKVETRPYGKITTNTSAGTQPIIGQNNTRSEIVYDDGTTQIYQRNVDTFTIKQGSSGQEKNEQIYASITTNKFYRTSGDVLTDTGSSRVIYDDGTVQVYEVGEEVVVAKEGGDAGQTKDEQIFATITTNSRFSTNSTVNTDTGNSRVVYRGGGVTIYQVNEETVVAKEGGDAGQTKAEQIFATITTNSRFSTNSTVNTDTGSSRVVYRGGGVTVYQVDEETVVAKEGGDAGTTIEEQIFATITTNSKFSTSSAVSTTTGRSRVVYRGGGVTIYQVDEETVVAKDGGDAGTTIRKTEAVTITTASSFNTTGAVTGDTGSSRVVYRGGGVVVYQSDNETAVVSNTDAGSSVEKNNFATVTTNSVFNTTGVVTGDTGRSRVTYRGGGITVYQVDNESTVANTSGNAGITKRKTEAVTITTTSNFNTTGAVTGDTGSSRVVYRGGGVVVYQSDNETAVLSNTAAGTSVEKNNFATVTTNSVFNTTGVVTGDTGRSRVTYRGGGITVYQVDNESTVANTSGNAGITKRKTEAVTITTTSNFNTTGAVTGDTGSSRVVYRGGGVVVYQSDNEVAALSNSDAGTSVEKNNFATVTTTSTFSTASNISGQTGRSRVTYRGGGITVYQVDSESTVANTSGIAGKTIRKTEAVTITTNSNFNTTGDVTGDTGSSRVVYRGGGVVVYQSDNETAVVSNTDAGSSIEKNNFATVTTNSVFNTSGVVTGGTGRSRVTYRGGGITVYQVDNESTVANTSGSAGTTIRKTEAVTITTASNFNTTGAVTGDTGSSRVVYRGGGVVVYQSDNETAVVSNTDAGASIEKNNFATVTTNSVFNTTGVVTGDTGRSRVTYRGGGITVYQVDNESTVANTTGNAGITKRKTEAVTITTTSNFNTTGAVTGDTGSSRVVYRGGGVVVYQSDNETAVVSNTDAGSSVEKNNFATVTTNSVFNTTGVVTGDTGRSRVTYRGGGITVYQVDNESTVANTSGNAGITKRKTEAVTITTTSNFNTTGAVTGDTGSSRVVYRGGGVVVYQSDNEVAVVSNTAAGTSIEKNNFATVTTNSVFNTTGVVTGDTGRSRVTYRGGGITVYQVDNESTVANTSGNAGITKRKTEAVTITTTSNFNTTGAVTGDTGSSRVVYRGGGVVVYQSDNEVAALSNSDAGTSIEKNNFATVTTTSTFSTASNITGQTGRSRVTYRGGGITVYQVDSESTVANTSGIAGKTIRKTEAVTITTNSNFNTTGDVTGDTGSSRVVYRGGGVVVYQSDNETAVVSNTDAGSSIEKNNFATVTTNSVFNTSGVVTGGTGRSRVTYRGGGITVYQVDNESTVANTSGSAGTTIRKTEAVTITTASNFNTTGAVTGDTGSSRVVYRGGGVVVYQSDNETAVLSNTAAGTSVEKNNFATVTTNSVFNTSGVVTGGTGRSRVTYRGGGITVYQVDNESTVANTTGNAGITKRKTEAVTITTNSNFNTTGDVTGDTGSSRVVYRGGGVVVYQSDNEVAALSNSDAGTSIEKNNFATVTTNSVFNTTGVVTGDTGRSRVTYRGGGITVYQVDNESTVANTTGNAGITKRKTEAVTITTTSEFNTTGAVTGDTGSSRVVYRGGGVVVYQSDNETAVLSNTAAGTSVEKNNFATVTTNSVFNTSGVVTGGTGRSRVTYRGGGITVYQVDNESTVANTTGNAGITKRKTEAVTITTTSEFNTTGAVTGDTGSSRVVYRGGGVVVYQSDNEVAAVSNSDAGTSIEKNNFATVTTTSTFSTASNISGQTGRSRVTYRGGGITVYQVDSESTVANTTGNAGTTIRQTEAATITTTSEFNITGAVSGVTGSSRVVYRGGGVVVYQSDNETAAITSNPNAGSSIEKNNFATVTTTSEFNTSGAVTGGTGRSRVAYRGGGIIVYQVDNESTVANTTGNAGTTIRQTEAATITTTSEFNITGAVSGVTGSSRVVYRGGGVVVYQSDNETAAITSNPNAGSSIEKNNFATVTTTSEFNTSGAVTGGTGRSRVAYRGGGIIVYQVDNESTVANTTGNAGTTIRQTEAATITTTSEFNITGAVSGVTGSSRVVYRGGGVVVYQSDNETAAITSNPNAGSSIEKNNFATVTTTSEFNTSGVVTGGTGRSRVAYRGGGIVVYQVDNESTVANTSGNAGITKRKTEAVTITTTSNFNTTGAVTGDTGSSRVVYRGGGVVVYQSDNESAVISNANAGQSVEKNNFATITTNSVFKTTGTVTSDTGRSRVTYRGGGIVVYQVDNETTTPNLTGVAGTTIRQTEAVTITTNSEFNTSGAVTGATGSSRVVYRGGGVVVYQSDNESAVVSNSDGGTTVEQNQYAKISTAISFSQSGSLSSETGRSRVIYRGGGAIVYQNENETVTPATGSAGTTKEKNNFAIITTTSTFALSGDVSSTTGRSRVVYRGGGQVIYQVDTESVAPNLLADAGTTREQNTYATVTTTSSYSTTGTFSGYGRSRVVYRGGDTVVYQQDSEEHVPLDGSAGTTRESRPYGTITTSSTFAASGNLTGAGNGRSRVVYRGGGIVVYQVDTESFAISAQSAGQGEEAQLYGTTKTDSTFSSSPSVTFGRSRPIYQNGSTIVYQVDEETFTESPPAATTSIQSTEWGTISTAISYGTSPVTPTGNGSSRPVFRGDKTTVVYENRDETPTIRVASFVSDRSEDAYRTTETNTTFATSPAATGGTGTRSSSRAVYNTPSTTIYRNDVTTFTPKAAIVYDSSRRYYWPPVLSEIASDTWNRKDGTSSISLAAVWAKNAYDGQCKTQVTQTWTLDAPAGSSGSAALMTPSPIVVATPIFKITIPSCLHGTQTISGTTGTSSEEWEYINYSYTFPSTGVTDWPASIDLGSEISNVAGGYLETKTTVYSP